MVISLKYYRFSQCKQTICPSLLRDDEPCSETGDGPCPGRCLSLLLIIVLFMTLRCSCSGSTAEAPLQVVALGCRETSTLGLPASNRTRRDQASHTMPIRQFYGWSIRKQSCERSGSDPDEMDLDQRALAEPLIDYPAQKTSHGITHAFVVTARPGWH